MPNTADKDESSHEQQSLLLTNLDKVDAGPSEPAQLSPFTVSRILALLWDSILTLLPLLLVVLAITAVRLNNKQLSAWGKSVVAATRLGPTMLPILFTALVGRFTKFLARYLMERGTTVTVNMKEPFTKLVSEKL